MGNGTPAFKALERDGLFKISQAMRRTQEPKKRDGAVDDVVHPGAGERQSSRIRQ